MDKLKTTVEFENFKYSPNGLTFKRLFTKEGVSPYSMFTYENRSSIIRNTDGSTVFEINNVEVPTFWSQVATDILAQKYFRKNGVPLVDEDGRPIIDAMTGEQKIGSENSIKQVAHRLAHCWKVWGLRYGYFRSQQDAIVFYDELVYMLINQMAAPNSPQWFNTGLAESYDIRGEAQGHYYCDPVTGDVHRSQDAYTRPQPHACFIQSVRDDLVNEGGIFDLVTREARIFKYGSGTGTNFSQIRGKGEKLSGGGTSSGLMSFLLVNDRAAGAIKSGGTTRRAAKMVCLDLDHPEIEEFVNWKSREEQKVAALVSGSKTNKKHLSRIMELASINDDLESNSELRSEIKQALNKDVPINYIQRSLQLAKQGQSVNFLDLDTHYESEAYLTVSGQNSNNSVRIPNAFFTALEEDGDWHLTARKDGSVFKTIKASHLWNEINTAAWMSADPGVQYDDTINEWHTCPKDGRINGSNPCSEYMFLDDTACNLASLNVMKFFDYKTSEFDVPAFEHAARLWTTVLEISVLMAQFPSYDIALKSYQYRTLGLGYANVGSLLMTSGIPYDSDKARSIVGAISAIMGGIAYATSAEIAGVVGPFPRYKQNQEDMLRVIRNHRRAAYNKSSSAYENLTVTPLGIDDELCPGYLVDAAKNAWDKALDWGMTYGYRNAQVTVIAPTGTIGLVMDCDTTGIEPDFALVKFKKLAGGGYFKIVNQSVPPALEHLGYTDEQIDDIVKYCVGHATLKGCPHINHESLMEKGLSLKEIEKVESGLVSAFDLSSAFSKWVLGEEVLKDIGVADVNGDVLTQLGFTSQQVKEANLFVCGTFTIEGAPHLKDHHLPVFDCANKCGALGERYLNFMSHILMMAATQPFISGAISKTINMDASATVEDIGIAYKKSWEVMVKAVALYRDGSKLSQPLNASNEESSALLALQYEDDVNDIGDAPTVVSPEQFQQAIAKQLSNKRRGYTQESVVGGQPITIRTGEFDDGSLAELSLEVFKEGSSQQALFNAIAKAVSIGLQHGAPLNEYVDEFTFTKFQPAGMVQGDSAIKSATSLIDYVFRNVGFEYLNRTDFVHVKDVPSKSAPQVTVEIKTQEPVSKPIEKKVPVVDDKIASAKARGYTGETCSNCSSMRLRQNGTCSICDDCGQTTGCS